MQHAHDTSNARAARARAVAVPATSPTSVEVALLFGAITGLLSALLVLLL